MIREWLTKKVSKTVEAAVEPTKEALKKSVETKSDWMTKLLRLGIVAFLTLLAFREEPRAIQERLPGEATHVVINNYIHEGRIEQSDSKHEDDR